MAPMFLVSNHEMLTAAIKSGIAGCVPALNYRKLEELEALFIQLNEEIKKHSKGTYGVNLIVQKTNIYYKTHLDLCVKHKVPFYITSLGNPKEVIEQAHSYGAKVFCDVTNLEHAQKCFDLGCDGFIAVAQGAGGHAGPFPMHLLVTALKEKFPNTIIIAAGGIATGEAIYNALTMGATGVSIGTRFIASTEAPVGNDYKQAIVKAQMKDIVLTEKLSGTPCNIINTAYAKKIGYRQNWLERFLSNNPRTKKWFKMWIQLSGMKKLESSINMGNYKALWCAGQSVEFIHEILSCEEIVSKLKKETSAAAIAVANLKFD
jgi:nitronate monooxygenase